MTEAAKKTEQKAAAKKTPASKPEHDVKVTDCPTSYAEQGGRVEATCTCGWTSGAPYTRDRYVSNVQDYVQSVADRHVEEAGRDA